MKTNWFLIIGLSLGIIVMFMGIIIGTIQYEYEIEKCASLDSAESNYDFDKTVELDAKYNVRCYFSGIYTRNLYIY